MLVVETAIITAPVVRESVRGHVPRLSCPQMAVPIDIHNIQDNGRHAPTLTLPR